jgi:hypothetical protein
VHGRVGILNVNGGKIMDENYVPLGDEWKKCVMKHRKEEIVEMLKKVCLERDALRDNSND